MPTEADDCHDFQNSYKAMKLRSLFKDSSAFPKWIVKLSAARNLFTNKNIMGKLLDGHVMQAALFLPCVHSWHCCSDELPTLPTFDPQNWRNTKPCNDLKASNHRCIYIYGKFTKHQRQHTVATMAVAAQSVGNMAKVPWAVHFTPIRWHQVLIIISNSTLVNRKVFWSRDLH